jgi:hypothetical protein
VTARQAAAAERSGVGRGREQAMARKRNGRGLHLLCPHAGGYSGGENGGGGKTVGNGKPWWPWLEWRLAHGLKGADKWAPPGLKIFPIFKSSQTCKFKTETFYYPKNPQTLHEARFEYFKQHSQLVRLQIPNKIHVINFGTNSNLNIL